MARIQPRRRRSPRWSGADRSAFSTSARARSGSPRIAQSQRAFAVEAWDLRAQLDGQIEVGHRPVDVSQVHAASGAVVMGPGLARDAADELVEFGAASAPFAQAVEGRAAMEVGVRQVGVEPQGLVAVGDRAAKISDLQPGEGPVFVRGGVIGGEADGRVEFGQRPGPILDLGVFPSRGRAGVGGRREGPRVAGAAGGTSARRSAGPSRSGRDRR